MRGFSRDEEGGGETRDERVDVCCRCRCRGKGRSSRRRSWQDWESATSRRALGLAATCCYLLLPALLRPWPTSAVVSATPTLTSAVSAAGAGAGAALLPGGWVCIPRPPRRRPRRRPHPKVIDRGSPAGRGCLSASIPGKYLIPYQTLPPLSGPPAHPAELVFSPQVNYMLTTSSGPATTRLM